MFAKNKDELLAHCPEIKPQYVDGNLSPYKGHFDCLDKIDPKFHFAPALIELILKYPNQEIGTHTFSHYYCLEKGQTKAEFKEDIRAAIKIATDKGIAIKSIVFPRNQFNSDYLEVIKELGISSYRGNETSWFHKAANNEDDNYFKRIFRLLDTYINISGHNCYSLSEIALREPFNIPSSRFLRPYSHKLRVLEILRLKRILDSMTYAAKENKIFHLWWHPHNFGINQEENLDFLEKILTHYSSLNVEYRFESLTMSNLVKIIKNTK